MEEGFDQGGYVAEPEVDEVPPEDPDGGDWSRQDRSEYVIHRENGEPFGRIESVEYNNGESIEFSYDENGGLSGVVDTASGTKMFKDEEGKWVMETAGGQKTYINGDISVNQETGAITATLDNGVIVTTQPSGRTSATRPDGSGIDQSIKQPAGGDKSGLK